MSRRSTAARNAIWRRGRLLINVGQWTRELSVSIPTIVCTRAKSIITCSDALRVRSHAAPGARCVACSTRTPIADALALHGAVRGAVFGQYGEASLDVHSLVCVAARECARKKWRAIGARSQNEAYGFYVAAQRRALGVSVVREFARHRLRRLGFIGVSLDQVREARDEAHMPWSARSSLSPEEADFFRFLQAGGPPRAP